MEVNGKEYLHVDPRVENVQFKQILNESAIFSSNDLSENYLAFVFVSCWAMNKQQDVKRYLGAEFRFRLTVGR